MPKTKDQLTQYLAERLGCEVARRDDSHIARRFYRQQDVDGVYGLDAGGDDCFHFLRAVGLMTLLAKVHRAAIQRSMIPQIQDVLLDGLKTCVGINSIHALPALLFSDEALARVPTRGRHTAGQADSRADQLSDNSQ